MNSLNRTTLILTLVLFGTGLSQAQSRELDVGLLNQNFKDMWGFRLNNFPKPDYVKNTRAALNAGQMGFDFRFVSVADYENNYKTASVTTYPFVSGSQVIIVLNDAAADKIVAVLDPGQPNHEIMLRVVDLGLLANELIFEMTTRAQRRDILSGLARTSRMSDEKEKEEALVAILKKYFPAYEIVKFFILLKLRFSELYPQESIIQTMDFITGRSTVDIIKQFIMSNLGF